jgi:hypothetical protein
VETWFAVQASRDDGPPGPRVSYPAGYWIDHEVLGYAPARSGATTVVKADSLEEIYRVTYTIDSLGLRIAPAGAGAEAPCVLFFGGSFTYGEGVDDVETLPHVAGVLSGYRTFNFGFHGYGPHQMLAALEEGLVADAVGDCEVGAVVYQVIRDHIHRTAGKAVWDERGPRYRLSPDSAALRDGNFDHRDRVPSGVLPFLAWKISNQFMKSLIVGRVRAALQSKDDEDFALFRAVVREARSEVAVRWPAAGFHLLLWDNTFSRSRAVSLRQDLEGADIEIHGVSEILAAGPEGESLRIGPKDGHPSAQAYRTLAEYVANRILVGLAGRGGS